MRLGPLAAALSVALLSACGSTVQGQGRHVVGSELGAGGTATAPQTSGSVAEGTTGATALPGTSGGQGPATSTRPRVPTMSSPPPVRRLAATKSPVEVGIVLFPDVGAFARALGGSAEVGDQRAQAEAAIRWINSHGGFAGHRVVPVYYEVELTSAQPYAVTYEEVCSHFTQDHHVVAVLVIANVEPPLPRCLAKTRTAYVSNGQYLYSTDDYRSIWNMVTPEDVRSDRVAHALVNEIQQRDLVKRGDKLGILVFDYAAPQQALNGIVRPAMKARGVDLVSYTIPWPQSTPDIANSVRAVQSAQLAMAAQGVKRVTFLCPGCFAFFMQYAESQAYYPRYVLTSLDGLAAFKGQGHARSLDGVVALGWDPVRDAGVYTNSGLLAGNATYTLCRQIEKEQYSDDTTLFAALAFCGGLQSLYHAARANPVSPVTGTSLLAGFEALGTSFGGASNFTTRLGPQQHDGVTSYRTMHYEAACDCLRYDRTSLVSFG